MDCSVLPDGKRRESPLHAHTRICIYLSSLIHFHWRFCMFIFYWDFLYFNYIYLFRNLWIYCQTFIYMFWLSSRYFPPFQSLQKTECGLYIRQYSPGIIPVFFLEWSNSKPLKSSLCLYDTMKSCSNNISFRMTD